MRISEGGGGKKDVHSDTNLGFLIRKEKLDKRVYVFNVILQARQ